MVLTSKITNPLGSPTTDLLYYTFHCLGNFSINTREFLIEQENVPLSLQLQNVLTQQ